MIEVLKQACGDGRLTLDEFSERVDAACQAVSLGDLPALLSDLPHPFGPDFAGVLSGEIDQSPVPIEPLVPDVDRKATRWTVSVMGGSQRKGRWRLREKTNAIAFMGGCHLDMRNAEVEGPSINISAIAIMGGIDIIVPEGIEVELGGIAIMGGKDVRLKDVPRIQGSPTVRVRAFAFWGGVTVRSRSAHASRGDKRAIDPPDHSPLDQRQISSEMSPVPRLIDSVAEGRIDDGEDDLESGSLPEGTVTIMFTDIEGFTSVTERLGDRRAMGALREHNDIVRRRIAGSGGHEIKAQGDGFMIAFSGASRALECAVGIQFDFAARNLTKPDVPIRVRLGLHSGEAVRTGNDFLGGAVILAARIAQQAAGGEILVSAVIKELCDLSGEFQFADGKDVYFRGLSEPRRVYSVTQKAVRNG